MPTRERRSTAIGLATLTVATFIAITTELLPIGLLPQMAREFGVTEGVVGLTVSVYAVFVAVLAIPLARLTDHFPRKGLLLVVLTAYALSNLIAVVAPDFVVVCIGRAIGGVAHAVFYSVVTGYVTRLLPPHRIGRGISIAFAGGSAGTVLGVPLATAIGTATDWRVAFLCVGAAAVVVAVAAALWAPRVGDEPVQQLREGEAGGGGWWRSAILMVGVANLLLFLGHNLVYTYIAPVLLEIGIPTAGLSVALLAIGVTGIAGLVISGIVVDRSPRTAALIFAGCIVVALAVLQALAGSPAAAFVAIIVWTTAFAGIAPMMMTAGIRSGVSASFAGAFINATANVGICLGSALGGLALTAGGPGLLPPVGAAIALAGGATVLLARRAFPGRSR